MRKCKPPYLYHGSQDKVDVLEPRPARGMGPDKDRLCAIYASHIREFVIPFALPKRPNHGDGYSWSVSFHSSSGLNSVEPTRIAIKGGQLDLSRVGYLYRVPSDTFEQLGKFQWVSYVAVKPLDCEIIHPQDYLHWIVSSDHAEHGNG